MLLEGTASPTSRLNPPLQTRSRQTLGRILDATEELLAERTFEQITIGELVKKSRSSVGAFYARFPDKDALLDALYDRYQRHMIEMAEKFLDPGRWKNSSLGELVQQIVRTSLKLHREQRGLLRTLVLRGYAKPDWRYGDPKERSRLMVAGVGRLIASRKSEFSHPNPKLAGSMAFLAILAVLREKILFAESTSSALEISNRKLENELVRMCLSYLGADLEPVRN